MSNLLVPERLRTNLSIALLAMQLHSAELSLYQLSLSGFKSPGSTHAMSTHHLKNELLSKALVAANSLVNEYLALPPGAETAFNNTQWMQLGFAMLVASRLLVGVSSLNLRIRAAEMAQRRVSWSNTLEQCRTRVDTLSTSQVDLNGDRDVFHNFRQRVIRIQKWVGEASENAASFDESQDQSRTEGPPADTTYGNYSLSIYHDDSFDSLIDPILGDWVNDTDFSW